MEDNRKPIEVKVISQTGSCACGHKVGDTWIVAAKTPEPGICATALCSMLDKIRILRYGGRFTYKENPIITTSACPDAENPVVFQIRRME